MLQIEPGESLWAFCLRKSDKVYVPAAELVAESVERLAIPHPEYGEYAVHGDRQRSRYFNIADCPDIESLTRNLDIVARSEALGMSFQGHNGVRAINDLDHESLRNFCVSLRTL
jgi:hypothetical protein